MKVTRPAADLERESLAFRLEQLEARGAASPAPTAAAAEATPVAPQPPPPAAGPAALRARAAPGRLAAHRPAGGRAEGRHSHRLALRESPPAGLAGDTLPSRFRPPPISTASWPRSKNATLLADALYEVTGRRFSLDFARRERRRGCRRHDPRRRGRDPRFDEEDVRRPRGDRRGGPMKGMDVSKMLNESSRCRPRWRRPRRSSPMRRSRPRPAARWLRSRRPAPWRSSR